jgi:hypothetical protein
LVDEKFNAYMKLTEQKKFETILKEAKKLETKYVIPELDNLVDETPYSVYVKVQHEVDMIEEGYRDEDMPKGSRTAWMKKGYKFLEKWKSVLGE